MIDPDNAKESILENLQWTESEMKEFLRKVVTQIATNKMTFDPYVAQDNSRVIVLKAIMHINGPAQPWVFQRLKERLEGTRVSMTFDNTSNESMMKVVFEGNRFKT